MTGIKTAEKKYYITKYLPTGKLHGGISYIGSELAFDANTECECFTDEQKWINKCEKLNIDISIFLPK